MSMMYAVVSPARQLVIWRVWTVLYNVSFCRSSRYRLLSANESFRVGTFNEQYYKGSDNPALLHGPPALWSLSDLEHNNTTSFYPADDLLLGLEENHPDVIARADMVTGANQQFYSFPIEFVTMTIPGFSDIARLSWLQPEARYDDDTWIQEVSIIHNYPVIPAGLHLFLYHHLNLRIDEFTARTSKFRFQKTDQVQLSTSETSFVASIDKIPPILPRLWQAQFTSDILLSLGIRSTQESIHISQIVLETYQG
jgi:hypothetical protein